MLEPANNPNPSFAVNPSRALRFVMAKVLGRIANTEQINKKRVTFEKKRQAQGGAHDIEYFHQLDDPYSHLMAQVIAQFSERYDVKIITHIIRATGGKNQPELEKLANWARRDAELIAPHYGLSFPQDAPVVPDSTSLDSAARALAVLDGDEFVAQLKQVSESLWTNTQTNEPSSSMDDVTAAMDKGSARLAELDHYSGATLYYGGEWYWG